MLAYVVVHIVCRRFLCMQTIKYTNTHTEGTYFSLQLLRSGKRRAKLQFYDLESNSQNHDTMNHVLFNYSTESCNVT